MPPYSHSQLQRKIYTILGACCWLKPSTKSPFMKVECIVEQALMPPNLFRDNYVVDGLSGRWGPDYPSTLEGNIGLNSSVILGMITYSFPVMKKSHCSLPKSHLDHQSLVMTNGLSGNCPLIKLNVVIYKAMSF